MGFFSSIGRAISSVFSAPVKLVSSITGWLGGGQRPSTNVTYNQAPAPQQNWANSAEYKAQQRSIDDLRSQLSQQKTDYSTSQASWQQQLATQQSNAIQREQLAASQAQSRYDSYDKQIAAFNLANQQRTAQAQYGASGGNTTTAVKANTAGSDSYNKRWFRRPAMSIGSAGGTGSSITDQSTNV